MDISRLSLRPFLGPTHCRPEMMFDSALADMASPRLWRRSTETSSEAEVVHTLTQVWGFSDILTRGINKVGSAY